MINEHLLFPTKAAIAKSLQTNYLQQLNIMKSLKKKYCCEKKQGERDKYVKLKELQETEAVSQGI